jgi:peptidoglycan/xylan/chitin deacetylase (PgdA/CDA1 family)
VNDVLVLCYHAVSERWPASLSVTSERLRHQLELLVRKGYRGVTFTRAVTDPPRGKVLAVTFDDGYRSVVTRAKPILERLSLPGTVFVVTEHVGSESPMVWSGIDQWLRTEHEPELTAASWPELEGLVRAGWEVGAHTRLHPHLTRVDTTALHAELIGSRQAVVKHLGTCTSLAYPYGDHDERVIEAAGQAGFVAAATLPSQWHRPEALRWPRVFVGHQDGPSRFRLKVSQPVRSARSHPAWSLLESRRRSRP